MADYDSLDSFLNRRTIFVKEIDYSLSKQQIRDELLQLCAPSVGRIVIPVDRVTANSLGCAYCNFNTPQLAEQALKRWRHKLKIKGKMVKMMYAVDSSESRDRVFGSWGLKFIVMVSHLGPDVDTKALCEKFESCGEILHCKVEVDQYGQNHGMVHYVHQSSVNLACSKLDRTPWNNTIIHVEPHRQRTLNVAATENTLRPSDFPALETPAPSTSRTVAHDANANGHVSSSSLSYFSHDQVSGTQDNSSNVYLNGHPVDTFQTVNNTLSNQSEPHINGIPYDLANQIGTAYSEIPQEVYQEAQLRQSSESIINPGMPVVTLRQSLLICLRSLERLGEMLCCPITQELLKDPVMAADGYTYERAAIEAWLEKNITSPMTNEVLASKYVVPNILVRLMIQDLLH